MRPKDWFRRRNSAGLRQGEWFFVPAPGLAVPDELVLRDGPLSRGWGKFHRLELAHRRGGVNVYVNAEHPTGITEQRFRNLQSAARRDGGWARMTRDPELYAKGAVRHLDHATIVLPFWHRVVMNTEHAARAMAHVAFLD